MNALSLAPDARDWLANSRHPRILHSFDHACNLINERREVLSIVTPQIGNGPFNLVIPRLQKSFGELSDRSESRQTPEVFSDLSLESPISIFPKQLHLGDLTINTSDAKLWSPYPDWKVLHDKRDDLLNQLMLSRASDSERSNLYHCEGIVSSPWSRYGLRNERSVLLDQRLLTMTLLQLPITTYQFSNSLLSAIITKDIQSSKNSAQQLAGLGAGLTPAGDDFILGAILAAWIIHPYEVARVFAEEIANTAAPLTTSLSAEYLKSAGRGGAGILWHEFFDTLVGADTVRIQMAMNKLFSVGETSGADALAGFIGTFISYAESEAKPCPS
jgi:hypothetical protein